MRAVLKVVPSSSSMMLVTMLEVDVGGMAVEIEPSHQYPVPCCCRVTDGSRGSVWQNGDWHESVYEAKLCHWDAPWGKNGTDILWHLLNIYGD